MDFKSIKIHSSTCLAEHGEELAARLFLQAKGPEKARQSPCRGDCHAFLALKPTQKPRKLEPFVVIARHEAISQKIYKSY
jgi:hypothetical protein